MPSPPRRNDVAPWRNFYGRRHGKQLRKGQIAHLDSTLRELAVPGASWDDNPGRQPVDLTQLFGRDGPVWLEIGFGGGEHLLHQALLNPEVNIIGCEPYVNGMAMLLPRLAEEHVANVRLHMGDARDLLDVLPDCALDRVFLLYPDPWPKARHHRRRFMNPEAIDPLAQAMKHGADLRVATDIADYVRHSMELMMPRPDFDWTADKPGDWRQPWVDWTSTRYEQKALREGRRPHYMTFRRTDVSAN